MAIKSILFVCPYPLEKAPSQRLKFEQYFDFFTENGFEVSFRSFQSEAMWQSVYEKSGLMTKVWYTILGYIHRSVDLFHIPQYDIVYIHLWVTPLGPPLFEWLYTKLAKKVVYDIDDLVYQENASAANSWVSKFKGKTKPIFLMKRADHIITTTSYLMSICKGYNAHVTSIPPSLDEKIIYPQEKIQKDKINIGWMGSHSTEQYLEIVREAIEKINKEFDIRLILMGAKNFTIEGLDIERHEWDKEMENEVLNQIDIALYPLRKEPWSEGKFGGKLIQYFAAGLPSIVSDANDSNREVIADEVNGLLVENSTAAWYLAIKTLLQNEELRKKIGHNARQDFIKNYSIDANKMKYLKMFESVIQN